MSRVETVARSNVQDRHRIVHGDASLNSDQTKGFQAQTVAIASLLLVYLLNFRSQYYLKKIEFCFCTGKYKSQISCYVEFPSIHDEKQWVFLLTTIVSHNNYSFLEMCM